MSNSDASQALKAILGGGTVAFHGIFARAINVNCALMISQGLFWQENAKFREVYTFPEHGEKSFFQKTAAEWYDVTGLSTEQQATARELLVRLGIFVEKKAGIPAKLYFHIDLEAFVSVVNQYNITGLPVSVKAKSKVPENPETKVPENPETKVPENPETVIGENRKHFIGIESIESFDSILEREESAFHAQLNTENTLEQHGASPAAPARKTPTKTQPKAQSETQPNTDPNTPQNTSPAARLRTAITESMFWIEENTDIVRDWFMLSKQTPPANNADIPAHLQDQVVSFFSYYQQQGNDRAIKKPVDFLQTSFIRWMQSNRERVATQAAQADRMDKAQNKAASAQQTDAAPLAHIPWV